MTVTVASEEQKNQEAEQISPAGSAPQADTAKADNGKNNTASLDLSRETKGEKMFRISRFWVAEAFILVTTAFLAYASAYKPKLFGRENKLYTWSRKLEQAMDKPWLNKRVSGAFANTMMTFHGGNAFAPIMYAFDRYKENIVTFFNKRFGTEEEVAVGKERVSKEPKPTLWTVIKGRIAAFAIVFSSFMTADLILRKNKHGNYRFDAFTDRAGRIYSHWFDRDKPLFSKQRLFNHEPADVLPGTPSDQIPARHKTFFDRSSYKFGKILSLDVFATTAAIFIWTTFNKIFAGRDAKKKGQGISAISEQKDKVLSAGYAKRQEEPSMVQDKNTAEKSIPAHAERTPQRTAEGYAALAREATGSQPARV